MSRCSKVLRFLFVESHIEKPALGCQASSSLWWGCCSTQTSGWGTEAHISVDSCRLGFMCQSPQLHPDSSNFNPTRRLWEGFLDRGPCGLGLKTRSSGPSGQCSLTQAHRRQQQQQQHGALGALCAPLPLLSPDPGRRRGPRRQGQEGCKCQERCRESEDAGGAQDSAGQPGPGGGPAEGAAGLADGLSEGYQGAHEVLPGLRPGEDLPRGERGLHLARGHPGHPADGLRERRPVRVPAPERGQRGRGLAGLQRHGVRGRLGGHDRRPHRLQELGDGDHRAARRRQGRELRHPVRRGQRQVVRQALPGQAALRLPVRHRLAGREGRAGRGILSPGGGVRGPPRPPRAGRLLSQIKWVHRDGEWLQSVPVPMGGESPGALLGSLGEGS